MAGLEGLNNCWGQEVAEQRLLALGEEPESIPALPVEPEDIRPTIAARLYLRMIVRRTPTTERGHEPLSPEEEVLFARAQAIVDREQEETRVFEDRKSYQLKTAKYARGRSR